MWLALDSPSLEPATTPGMLGVKLAIWRRRVRVRLAQRVRPPGDNGSGRRWGGSGPDLVGRRHNAAHRSAWRCTRPDETDMRDIPCTARLAAPPISQDEHRNDLFQMCIAIFFIFLFIFFGMGERTKQIWNGRACGDGILAHRCLQVRVANPTQQSCAPGQSVSMPSKGTRLRSGRTIRDRSRKVES